HRVHRARGVHDADDDGVGLLAHVGDQVAVGEVVVVERKAALVAVLLYLLAVLQLAPARRHHALDPRAHRTALVEALAEAVLAIAVALGRTLGRNLAQLLAFEIGELEILEHQIDELVEPDVGLVIIDAGPIAGAVRTPLALPLLPADDLAGL